MLLTGVLFIVLSHASGGGQNSLTDTEVDRKFSTWNHKTNVHENSRSRSAVQYTNGGFEDDERPVNFPEFEGSGDGRYCSDDEEGRITGMARRLYEGSGDTFNGAYDEGICTIPDKKEPGTTVCNFTSTSKTPSRLPPSLYKRVSLTVLYVYGSRKLQFRPLCLEQLHLIDCLDLDVIDYRSEGKCGLPLGLLKIWNSQVDVIFGNFTRAIVNRSVIGNLKITLPPAAGHIYIGSSEIITLKGIMTQTYNSFQVVSSRINTTLPGGLTVSNRSYGKKPISITHTIFESIEPSGIQVQSGRLSMVNVSIGHLGKGGIKLLGSGKVSMIQVKILNSSFEGISLEGQGTEVYMKDLTLDGVVLSARIVSTSSKPLVLHPLRLSLRQGNPLGPAIVAVLCALAFASGVLAGALVSYCCCLGKRETTEIQITEPPQTRAQGVEEIVVGGGGRGGGGGGRGGGRRGGGRGGGGRRDVEMTKPAAPVRFAQVLGREAEQEPIYGNIRQPFRQGRGGDPSIQGANEEPLYQDTSEEAFYEDTSNGPHYHDTDGKPPYHGRGEQAYSQDDAGEPLYQDTGRETVYQDTGRTPIYQDTGRPPVYQDTGRETVYQDTGREPVYQDTGRTPIYQDTGREPVYQDTGRAPIYQDTGREPVYQDTGREPVYQDTGRAPIYQDTGREPVYQDTRSSLVYQDARGAIKPSLQASGKQHPSFSEEPIYGNIEQEPIYGNIKSSRVNLTCEDDDENDLYANYIVDEEIYANI